MYRRILAAVNEYSNSELAARYAISLAHACQAKLTLIFVAAQGMDLTLIRQAEAALERLFLEAAAKNLEVESIIKRGEALPHISAVVRENEIDLAFSATRHEDVSRRYFTRTVARKLMLNLPCSVALVRVVHPGQLFPQNILVPFRGRPPHLEEKAFFVGKLAEAFSAAVTLFHAPEPISRFFADLRRGKPPAPEKHIPHEIDRFLNYLEKFRISPQHRLGLGPAGRAITLEAALQRHDLIIMGASERGLWESLISRDPVEEVLRETPCNLIILLPRLKRP
ncbi:MAG: universal stress protein [Deltaproteobacteria bacterium]|nr:universal stress protein [Deltaproteobacteria bacterium]